MIEHWDKSREKVQELRLDQWGTTEEVAVMAAPLRWANNRREATAILKEIAERSPFTRKNRTLVCDSVAILSALYIHPARRPYHKYRTRL